MRKYTSWNRVLDMCIYVKMDAENNETTPAIAFLRFHEDFEIYTKKASKKCHASAQIVELEKKQGQIWNQRPFKRTGPPWPVLSIIVCQKIDET